MSFDHKDIADWTIEGPEHLKRFGYQPKYNRKLQKVEIATEENILLGRSDRKKISMVEIPLTEDITKNFGQ
jgi:NADH-quinone oxidoreductase subunit G